MCRGRDRSATLPYGSGKSEGKITNSKIASIERHLIDMFFKILHSLNSVIPLKIINPGKSFKKRRKLYVQMYL